MTEYVQVPGRRLGKRPYVHDPSRAMLSDLRTGVALPAPAQASQWSTYVTSWPMYLNDTLGDCTCAEVGHHEQLFTATTGTEVTVADADVLALYEQAGGYVPGQPATDQGADIVTVLDDWVSTGIAGRKALAHAGVNPGDHDQVASAVQTFGGLSIGIQLPVAAQQMTGAWTAPPGWAETWTPAPIPAPGPPGPTPVQRPWWWRWWHDLFGVTRAETAKMGARTPLTGAWAPGGWGGHCVFVLDVSATGVGLVTWGQYWTMEWGFWDAYVDEAHAVTDPDFIRSTGVDVSGYDLAQLEGYLGSLTPEATS